MNSFKSQSIENVFFTLIKAMVFLYAISLASEYLPVTLLGLSLLFRRQGGMFAGALGLGLTQSILKYSTSREGRDEEYLACFDISVLVIFMVSLVGYFYGDIFSELLFKNKDVSLGFYFTIYTIGLIVNFLAYSSWLTIMNFRIANLVELLSVGVTFIVAIVVYNNTKSGHFFWMILSFGCLFISSIFLFIFMSIEKIHPFKFVKNRFYDGKMKVKVLMFGIPRGISAFLEGGIYVIGPWFLVSEPEEAGYLIIALSVLKLLQTAITPISQIISLRVLKTIAEKNQPEQKRLLSLLMYTSVISFVGVMMYPLLKVSILTFWLGSNAENVLYYLNELIYIMPALAAFYLLRNFIDLYFSLPITSIYFIIWFSIFFVCYFTTSLLGFEKNEIILTSVVFAMSSLYIYVIIFFCYLIKNGIKYND
jgi:hypothetical protein